MSVLSAFRCEPFVPLHWQGRRHRNIHCCQAIDRLAHTARGARAKIIRIHDVFARTINLATMSLFKHVCTMFCVDDQFGATRTPEVFVLDHKWNIVYQGRIDDQYEPGVAWNSANRAELRIAIEETLAGKALSIAKVDAVDCLIGKVRPMKNAAVEITASSAVTYCKRHQRRRAEALFAVSSERRDCSVRFGDL